MLRYIPRIHEHTLSTFYEDRCRSEPEVSRFATEMRAYIAKNPGLSDFVEMMKATSGDPDSVEETVHGLLYLISAQKEVDELNAQAKLVCKN